MKPERIYITLIHFYGVGKSERWIMPNIPNKGDIININKTSRKVSYIEYNIGMLTDSENICNVFIYTEDVK